MKFKTKDKYDSIVFKNMYENIKKEIILSAIFYSVYTQKISNETISAKVSNQLNSMNISIAKINPKFIEKSKNYDKIKEQLTDTLKNYEANLIQLSKKYDLEIENIILEKVEIESKLLMAIIAKEYFYERDNREKKLKDRNIIIKGVSSIVEKIKKSTKEKKQLDVGLINRIKDKQDIEIEIEEKNKFSEEYKQNKRKVRRLKKEISKLNRKLDDLNEKKINKIFACMEAGNGAISKQIRRTHTIKKITTFFINRLNTYNVIQKSVIEPVNNRINEFKVNELKKIDFDYKEIDLEEVKKKIKYRQDIVLNNLNHKIICKQMGIFSK